VNTIFLRINRFTPPLVFELLFPRELRVCPPPKIDCQQNVGVIRSAFRTVGFTLFCCSPVFPGGGVKRVIPKFFIALSLLLCVPTVQAQDQVTKVDMSTFHAAPLDTVAKPIAPGPFASMEFLHSPLGNQTAYQYKLGQWKKICDLPCIANLDSGRTPLIKIHRSHGGFFDEVDAVDTVPVQWGSQVKVATSSQVDHLDAMRKIFVVGPLSGALLGSMLWAGIEKLGGNDIGVVFVPIGFACGFAVPLISWISGGFLVDEIEMKKSPISISPSILPSGQVGGHLEGRF